ncbi:ferritin-like fold-containing protein [Amnibacterium kyonggiense]
MIRVGRRRPAAPRTGSGEQPKVVRMALGDLRPDTDALLGRIAYLKLALFESASAVAGRATDLADREAITRVAAVVLEQHTLLTSMIEARGLTSAAAMHPFTADIDRYRRRLADSGWHESVLTLHLSAGLLDGFFAGLAAGLPEPEAGRVVAILQRDVGHDALVAVLQAGLAADGRLGSRLALWGRRLVGDTLLVARAALADVRDSAGQPASTEQRRIEPILNDLIAAHTRRMDRLGLTA